MTEQNEQRNTSQANSELLLQEEENLKIILYQ